MASLHGPSALAELQANTDASYSTFVTGYRPSCALSLLALWDRPWSPAALRYAYHVLYRALARGCDVLEAAALPYERGCPHE